MTDWLLSIVMAGVVAWVLLYGLNRWCAGLALDQPNARSLHGDPVPRIGGLGVAAGVSVSALAFGSGGFGWGLALALILATISWLDDWRGLPVAPRLLLHLAVASAWTFAAGFHGIAALTLVLAVVWTTNLYNFMDGSDGLAGGMAVTGFGCYAIAAWWAGDPDLSRQAGSVAVATLAFLWFNLPPARLFLGDVGAIPLGFLATAMGLEGWQRGLWTWLLPVLTFAPFIADASFTLARRLARKERVWEAHREHYYQRLIRMGWSKSQLLLVAYPLMVIAAACALVATKWHDLAMIAGAICVVSLVLAGSWIDRCWKRHGKRQQS